MGELSTLCWKIIVKINILVLLVSSSFSAKNGNGSNISIYDVGIILDMESPLGKIGNVCTSMAVTDFYSRFNTSKTRLLLHPKDSMGDPLHAFYSAMHLLENEKVQAIIGPQTSEEAELVARLGDQTKVPIISFSATSPILSRIKTPYFVRFATNDNSQIGALVSIFEAFSWREVIIIHEDTLYGNGILPDLILSLEAINVRIPCRTAIHPSFEEDRISLELYKLKTMSTRIFIVHMSTSLACKFFVKVNEVGMMSEGYAWIITDGITNNLYSMDSLVIHSMQGVIGIKTYTRFSDRLKNFTWKWRSTIQDDSDSSVNVFCLRAYDAVWALARAIEVVNNIQNIRKHGQEIVKAISETKFKGVSGDIELSRSGELKPEAIFEIVNIVGDGAKEVALLKSNSDQHDAYSPAIVELKSSSIRWPGKSTFVPKSWSEAAGNTNGKRLKIAVPVGTFKELVDMKVDPETNATNLSGFCIDVFKDAIGMLPYSVAYDLIPLQRISYSDIIYQVHLQIYDGAVGDISITANRTKYVDFTAPFTKLGMGVVVPAGNVKDIKSMWIFLKPFATTLWLASAAFFIWTGLLVWFIEFGLNNYEEFKHKKPINYKQVGTSFGYYFMLLSLAQWDKLKSKLSKFIVIIWILVLFILTSSYTANLSSLLTVRQLQRLPTQGEIFFRSLWDKNLISNAVSGKETLKPLKSIEYYDTALKNNKSASAFVDEITYLRLFLAYYPHQYIMKEFSYEASNGFGFAFRKGSPLAADVSAMIIKLRENYQLQLLEKKWFGGQNEEFDNPPDDADILTFYTFRGLFLVAGAASLLSLIVLIITKIKSSHDKQGLEIVKQNVQQSID